MTEGGGSHAPPPVGGLGNYKGVMLCNRPSDDASRQGGAGGQLPFKTTISATVGEQVGLPPAKKVEVHAQTVKTCGPSAALRRHVKWIKELQEQVREDKTQAEEGTQAEQARRQRMHEAMAMQRNAIRQIKSGKDLASIEHHEVAAALMPKGKKAAAGGGSQKPMWAMTEAEKDVAEDDEAKDLIQFAEDLDFDRYISDMEFRECLAVVRDRAKKLQREQDAFKDSILHAFNAEGEGDDEFPNDGASSEAGSLRGRARYGSAGADDRPDWDASTAGGEDHLVLDRETRNAAEQALAANPKLKGIHSKASVQRVLEKASQASEAG